MGNMKTFSKFLSESPARSVVLIFGRFQPTTVAHEAMINYAKGIASKTHSDLVIYVSKTQDAKKNPLSVQQKIHYLQLSFPGVTFIAADDKVRTPVEAAKHLNAKYSNLTMIAGGDRVKPFKDLLEQYNGKEYHYSTIKVLNAGERDPDSDDLAGMSASKVRQLVKDGHIEEFLKTTPSKLREVDARRMYNDLRVGMKLEPIKEFVEVEHPVVREKLLRSGAFWSGMIVEDSNNEKFYVADIGANHLLLINSNGIITRKWVSDCRMCEAQNIKDVFGKKFNILGYQPINIQIKEIRKAFTESLNEAEDKIKVLNAVKKMDECMGHAELDKAALLSLQESVSLLRQAGQLDKHEFYINKLLEG